MNYEKLEKAVMFKIQETDKDDIQKLIKSIEKVKGINTDGINAITFPFDEKTTYLREDDNCYATAKTDILANAQNDGNYVTISKGVK